MADHSPEPWAYEALAEFVDVLASGHEGRIVAEIRVHPSGPIYWITAPKLGDPREDARRIVAGVNACRGVDTETLEGAARGEHQLVVELGSQATVPKFFMT